MQNEINIVLTPAQLQAIDDLLTALETATALFPKNVDKAQYVKAPDDSRGWMEGMLNRAQQNLNAMPRDFDPALIQNDLNLSAALNPRILRLQRITQHFTDATFLADSDAFSDLLEARRRLQDAGVSGVDDNLNDGMNRFFNRSKRAKPTPPTP